MFENFRTETLATTQVGINARLGGVGEAVLLLHGFPQNLAVWAHVAPVLAREFTVVCTDLRGYGDSDKPIAADDLGGYGFRQMAQDQVEAMRSLGFDRFHVVGHDRGARTAYRMALDHPDVVLSLTVMDVVPTEDMFAGADAEVARAYWHWFFLQQPAPFPENVIAADPDTFYQGCLVGWGATRLDDFDPELLAAYRRTWRQSAAIAGSCNDYRAAALVDLPMDRADQGRLVNCPALVMWGRDGVIAGLFDIEQAWSSRLGRFESCPMPGGHFFIDQHPDHTAQVLAGFLSRAGNADDTRPR